MCEVSLSTWSFKRVEAVLDGSGCSLQDASCWVIHPYAPAAPTPSWSTLPQHILVQILQHVPVEDRFRNCAFVTTDWAAAVVEATNSITLPGRCYHLANFQLWLTQHGHTITTISLTSQPDQEMMLLPCSNLRQLDLAQVSVQLTAAVGGLFPGILSDIPSLTRLTLRHTSVVGGPNALTALAGLTALQHLALDDMDMRQFPPSQSDWFPVPGSLFPQLLKLTHLELDRCVSNSTLEHLSSLPKLQELLLGRLSAHNTSAAALSGLESLPRLQWLLLDSLETAISTSSIPSLGQLTRLTRLQLLNCKGFQPILLSGMLDLQVLDIQGTPLLGTGGVLAEAPAGQLAGGIAAAAAAEGAGGAGAAGGGGVGAAAGGGGGGFPAVGPQAPAAPAAAPANMNAAAAAVDLDLDAALAAALAEADDDPIAATQQAAAQAAVAQAAAGAAVLLQELPKLQQLTHLSLVQVLWAHAEGLPAAAYAALTTSSKLQHLDLSFSLIPADAWLHIFQRRTSCAALPKLKTLSILCSKAPITDQTLGFVAQSCPELQVLAIKGSMQEGAQLTALLGFSALTSLTLNHVSSSKAVGVLAQLRGLEDLQISCCSDIGASGLLQLSTLRGLTRLRVESSPETWIAKYGLLLFLNQMPAGAPANVWSQLESWCLHKLGTAASNGAGAAAAGSVKHRTAGSEPGRLWRWLGRCITG